MTPDPDPVSAPEPAPGAGGDPRSAAAGGEVAARAVRVFADALRLSCLAAGRPAHDPTRSALADRAVAAYVAARALAEEAVRRAARP